MDDAPRCMNPECGAAIKFRAFRYQQIRYPYNPEWPLEVDRAAVTCSPGCLIALVESDSRISAPAAPVEGQTK